MEATEAQPAAMMGRLCFSISQMAAISKLDGSMP